MTAWGDCAEDIGTEWAGCGECAGFAGDYAPENWTWTGVGQTIPYADVDWTGAPDTLVITGSTAVPQDAGQDPNFGNPGETRAQITVPADGTISFDWAYVNDQYGAGYDEFGYALDGAFVRLTSDCAAVDPGPYCPTNESGSISFAATAGQVLTIEQRTSDNIGTAGAVATITNFCVGAA